MDKYKLVLDAEQLDFLRDALKETQEQFDLNRETFRDYSDEDVRRFKARMNSATLVLAKADKVEQLPRPTHNGEWGYCAEGKTCVQSVVFVDGVSTEDPGYILADLNDGLLEGKPVESLPGTWKEVWLP